MVNISLLSKRGNPNSEASDKTKLYVEQIKIKEDHFISNDDLEDWEEVVPASYEETKVGIKDILPNLGKSVIEIAGFDKSKLLDMCQFGKISYCNDGLKLKAEGYKTVQEWENDGYKVTAFSNSYQEAGYIFTKGDEITIAYRGTKTKADIQTDLNLPLSTAQLFPEGGRLHPGFYNAFKDSKDTVFSAIEEYAKIRGKSVNELKLNFTGHSMGGAVAKVAAYAAKKEFITENISVATFGDPRVFDLPASELYNKALGQKTIRVTQHRADPVPASPPGHWGYSHVGLQLRVQPPEYSKVHKINGYFNGIKAVAEKDFKENNSVSIFYPISKGLQYLNSWTIGNAQHYWRSYTKGWADGELNRREQNASNTIAPAVN